MNFISFCFSQAVFFFSSVRGASLFWLALLKKKDLGDQVFQAARTRIFRIRAAHHNAFPFFVLLILQEKKNFEKGFRLM
jgi:hypothetical protein